MSYTYDDAGRLASVVDANANKLTYEYDDLGRNVRTLYSGKTQIRTIYDFPEDARAYLTTSAFSSANLDDILASLTNTRGRVVASISYDVNFVSNEPDYANKVIDLFSYDDEGRINCKYKSIPGISLQKIKFGYDLQGKPLADTIEYDGTSAHDIVTLYNYNERGKLESTARSPINITPKTFARYEYDDLGRLIHKTFVPGMNNETRNLYYRYNIRDWVDTIQTYDDASKDNTFSEQLCYDVNTLGALTSPLTCKPQYNGNISRAKYSLTDGSNTLPPEASLDLVYNYDNMNRLTGVTNNNTTLNATEYNGTFQYLNDGRIAQKNEGSAQKDWTAYTYVTGTNRLAYIVGSKIKDKTTDGTPNYVYDYNGNMVFDRSKGMIVSYDWRNLPVKFSFYKDILTKDISTYSDIANSKFSGTHVSDVEMLYDASGNRVKKETVDFSSQTCSDPAPGQPGLLITYEDAKGTDKTVMITSNGDLKTCLPVAPTSKTIPVNALMIQTNENVLITFSDAGVQFGGQAVLADILSANVGDMAVYYNTGTTTKTNLVMAKDGSSVKIAGTMPDHIVNSGVAYVDNASTFVKSSFVSLYELSYVNFDDGVSNKNNDFDFYIKDHLGSTRMVLTEANRSVMLKEATNYLAYGSLRTLHLPNEKVDEARKKFTGKEFDEDGVDSGNGVGGIRLSYFGARYYDPEVGKWTVVDPAYQYLDAYNYCSNNPIFGVDRNGRDGPNAERYWNPSGVEEGNDAANHDYAFENQTYQAIKVAIAVPVVASTILIVPKVPAVAVAIIPRLYTAYGDAVAWSFENPAKAAILGVMLYYHFHEYLPSQFPQNCGMGDIIAWAGFPNIALGWKSASNTLGVFNGIQNSDQSSLKLGSSYFGQSNKGLSDMKLDVSAPTFQPMAADATSTQ